MARWAVRGILGVWLLLPGAGAAGGFPSPRADLAAVLRFLDPLPSDWSDRSSVPLRRHEIQVFRFDVLPWEEIDPSAILSGQYAASADASYGVRVGVSCRWEAEGDDHESRVLWYVVAGGRLRSYDHFEFDPARGCEPSRGFRREGDADLDFVVALRAGQGCCVHYERTCPSVEAHERGLAYAAAERTEEAAALLAFGDAFVRLDRQGEVASAATGPGCNAPARRARRALHQRLAGIGEALPAVPSASP